MKFVEVLTILSTLLIFNVANSAAMEDLEADYNVYCTEQAEMSGIEDAAEKSNYIKECIESFKVPSGDAPPQDQ